MADPSLLPLLDKGALDRSVIGGAPEGFHLLSTLRNASAVRIAMAFGHLSGWEEIEEHLRGSHASRIRVLFGQAFYQTEPQVLLRIRKLQEDGEPFEVKLASAVGTFHPKVWVIDGNGTACCIVGSANLSRSGLLLNVECGL